jgi:hypothetical protein
MLNDEIEKKSILKKDQSQLMQTIETHDCNNEEETDHIKRKPKKQRSKKLTKKMLSDEFEKKFF